MTAAADGPYSWKQYESDDGQRYWFAEYGDREVMVKESTESVPGLTAYAMYCREGHSGQFEFAGDTSGIFGSRDALEPFAERYLLEAARTLPPSQLSDPRK